MPTPARCALLALLLLPLAPARAQEPPPKGFVDAAAVIEGLAVDMRYFGDNNFVGTRIDGYERPRCLLTRQAADALAAIQRDLAGRGLALKMFDCYRPTRAVAHFIRWAQRIDDVKRKAEFYPDIDKRDLFRLGYIAARSGHSRGSTVDLTLIRRADGAELDGHGHAVRFLRPAIVALRPAGERGGAQEPRAPGRRHDARRLPALPQGVVALHAGERAVPGHLFQFPGAVIGARIRVPLRRHARESGHPVVPAAAVRQ